MIADTSAPRDDFGGMIADASAPRDDFGGMIADTSAPRDEQGVDLRPEKCTQMPGKIQSCNSKK